jgi:hypothetical protein
VALTREQQRVLSVLLGEGRRIADPHVRRVFNRAAVETGLVESGLRNLPGGDADSAGWRQERASLYPNPTNLHASARRFRREFLAAYDPGKPSWQIAAEVQRPAAQFRGRYRDVADQAAQILRGARGSSPAVQLGSPVAGAAPGAPVGLTVGPDAGGGVDVSTLLAALQQNRRQAPTSMGVQAPSFAAGPTLPQGYQAPISGGGPEARQDIGSLLSLVRTQGGGEIPSAGGAVSDAGGPQTPVQGSGGTQTPGGKVTVAAGANRPGTKINPAVLGFVRGVAGRYGAPLTIGTGTNHSRLTINGTVSDHYDGNGADIPLTGRALIRAGQDALIQAGMPAAQARKQTGGGYNVGGWQVIFNTNAPGWGDHTTHLHVGRRRR